MQHIIKKQIVNLSLDQKLNAFHIQHLVSDQYWNKIVPILQKAFDAVSSEDEIISLDTFEIDLGIMNVKEIEKGNWEDEVLKKITEQLLPIKHGLSSKEKVIKKSRALSISEQWIFYMQYGYLPWNVLQVNKDWYDKVLEAFAGDATAIGNLRNLISRNPNSVKRIIFQHSEFFLKALIETLTAENQDALLQFINESSEIVPLSKQKLWEQALEFSAYGEKDLNTSKIVTHLLNANFSKKISKKSLKDLLLKNDINASSLKKIKANPDNLEKRKPGNEDFISDVNKAEIISTISEEGIYVSGAGIVLLHPFITRFFRNLQLVKEGNFVDTLSHKKALHLLHYLSTGNINPEEHELVIAKVLCSFPFEEPVNNLIKLTIEELQEADSLLLSAIQQWEVLKNTSPDGLREGFLQRNGKLFTKNANLYLQVESSSIDVLLDQLPWNLSLVKLPWMADILKVEWR